MTTSDDTDGQALEAPAGDAPALPVRARLTTVPGGIAELDEPVRELRLDDGEPIRLRMPLQVYMLGVTQGYAMWPRVTFGVEFAKAEDVIAFRKDLQGFIEGWIAERRS